MLWQGRGIQRSGGLVLWMHFGGHEKVPGSSATNWLGEGGGGVVNLWK